MSEPTSTDFATRVRDRNAGPCRLLTLRTPVERFVSWRGSFLAYPDLGAGDEMRQELTVSLLDKGTQQRDRFEVARVLEDRGAQLGLSSDGLYVDFYGRALREDLPDVMAVLAEMLVEPLFDPDEFEKARAQTIAELQREMEDTGAQASGALSRRLFPDAHPNYSPPFEAQVEQLETLTPESVRSYHDEHFGANEFTLAVVGDLDHDAVARAVDNAFQGWGPHDVPSRHATDPAPAVPGQSTVPMPDKSNVDVRMGHALPIRRDDEDYLPLYVGNYILGGNFSARLMATIRDELGLTYHIGSGFSGITTRYCGYWQVGVTLSQEKMEGGIGATRQEVRRFVEEGATEDELAAKKTTITGSYKVGLATTRRLAQSLLTNAERGFDTGYLDRFPSEVEALTLEQVSAAIRRYLRPDDLHVALAGTLPETVQA